MTDAEVFDALRDNLYLKTSSSTVYDEILRDLRTNPNPKDYGKNIVDDVTLKVTSSKGSSSTTIPTERAFIPSSGSGGGSSLSPLGYTFVTEKSPAKVKKGNTANNSRAEFSGQDEGVVEQTTSRESLFSPADASEDTKKKKKSKKKTEETVTLAETSAATSTTVL